MLPLIISAAPVYAGVRHYGANLRAAQWTLAENNPLSCRLEHNIPQYGTALFEARAGRRSDIQFILQSRRQTLQVTKASLVAVAPRWRPGRASEDLGQINVYPGYATGTKNKKTAWTMLTELERGYEPTLFFEDGMSQYDSISVSLSSARFHKSYDEFANCLSGLLPFGFHDLELTVLHYEKNSQHLDLDSRKRLQFLATYLKYDKDVTAILVDAFSDSYGGRWHNQKLSEQRGDSIRNYLTSQGIPEQQIKNEAHGETRHVASNETEMGREQNRRVVIRLVRGGPQV